MVDHVMEAHFNLKADASTASEAHAQAIEISNRVVAKMTDAVIAGLGMPGSPFNRIGISEQCTVIYVAVNAMMAALADEGIVRYEGINPEPATVPMGDDPTIDHAPDPEPEADGPKGKRKHK